MRRLVRRVTSVLTRRGRARNARLTVAVLSLGIGLPTAIFSLVDGVLLRGLPLPGGDRVAFVATAGGPDQPMPPEDFLVLREQQRTFSEVAAFRTFNTVVTAAGGGSKGLTATYVTGNLFRMLGARPLLGRAFLPADEDPAAPPVAVLSHAVWQDQFAGDSGVIGRTVVLNRETMTVVGVMPPGFHFPIRQEAWAALRWEGEPWSAAPVFAIGRLPDGVSDAAAARSLAPLLARLDAERPAGEARQAHVRGYAETLLPPEVQRSLRLLLGAVVMVLLLASANAASLRLSDALARDRELAVRRALGAGSGRLLRLLVAEAAVLVAASTLGGLILAWALVQLVDRFFLQGSALVRFFWIDVHLDLRSALFAALMAGAAILLGGLLPAVWALRRRELRPAAAGATASAGALRLTGCLVVGQVAVCFALVGSSALLLRSGLSLLGREPAFDPAGLMRIRVAGYQAARETPEARRAFWEALLPRLATAPEIAGVTLATAVPWSGGAQVKVRSAGFADVAAADLPVASLSHVLPGFFATLRWPVLAGRPLRDSDVQVAAAAALPVVVSASFARRHLAGAPLGAFLEIPAEAPDTEPLRATVVGVVADVGLPRRDAPAGEAAIYAPFSLAERAGGILVVRGRTATADLVRRIDHEIAAIDPLVATLDDRTYAAERAEQVWVERRVAELFTAFATAALALSAGGLFGLVTLRFQRRRRELAVRSALGARPRELAALLLRDGARHAFAGLALGTGLLAPTNRAIRGFLLDVQPWEPGLTGAAALVVSLVLLIAAMGPARRAFRVDPAAALAAE